MRETWSTNLDAWRICVRSDKIVFVNSTSSKSYMKIKIHDHTFKLYLYDNLYLIFNLVPYAGLEIGASQWPKVAHIWETAGEKDFRLPSQKLNASRSSTNQNGRQKIIWPPISPQALYGRFYKGPFTRAIFVCDFSFLAKVIKQIY